MRKISPRQFELLQTADPFALFAAWFAEAQAAEPANAEAMTLATARADGMPQARSVLLKRFNERGFVFYTNTQSRKGRALAANPRAALLFYWKSLGRQFLAEGQTRKFSAAETLPYFASRPRGSQAAAWASRQSRPLRQLADLQKAAAAANARPGALPLPPHWRGFCLAPERMEFWQEGASRLHRRLEFLPAKGGGWRGRLLCP